MARAQDEGTLTSVQCARWDPHCEDVLTLSDATGRWVRWNLRTDEKSCFALHDRATGQASKRVAMPVARLARPSAR